MPCHPFPVRERLAGLMPAATLRAIVDPHRRAVAALVGEVVAQCWEGQRILPDGQSLAHMVKYLA